MECYKKYRKLLNTTFNVISNEMKEIKRRIKVESSSKESNGSSLDSPNSLEKQRRRRKVSGEVKRTPQQKVEIAATGLFINLLIVNYFREIYVPGWLLDELWPKQMQQTFFQENRELDKVVQAASEASMILDTSPKLFNEFVSKKSSIYNSFALLFCDKIVSLCFALNGRDGWETTIVLLVSKQRVCCWTQFLPQTKTPLPSSSLFADGFSTLYPPSLTFQVTMKPAK